MAENANELMEKLTALCKRRGFIFPSSEIYGGIGGFWDYGPLGVELKRNIKDAWWTDVVRRRDDMMGVDCSIIMNPRVWEASGHVGGFADPMVDCKECKRRFRADQLYFVRLLKEGGEALYEGIIQTSVETAEQVVAEVSAKVNSDARRKIEQARKQGRLTVDGPTPLTGGLQNARCPECGGELTEPRAFNLMLATKIGALEDSSATAYLRPETAQGIFCNYKNVLDTQRIKLPFGIAQVGKSFRNEINPRNYTFRSREFEQMEIEFFCHPDQADTWYEYWRNERYQWYVRHGLQSSRLRLRDHQKDELAFYARACADVEYEFPFGISELEGIANRTNYDLTQHQKFSGKDLSYFDDDAWEADKAKFHPDQFGGDAKAAKAAADQAKQGPPYRFMPFVIEPSGGCDRAALAFLCEAYCEDQAPDENGVMQTRVVMKLHPRFAPIKAAIFPLVKKEGMPEIATGIYKELQNAGIAAFYDEKGAVGRRYRRQDEAGTPYCITVDGQSLTDSTVTVRDRDSLSQERINVSEVLGYVRKRIG